MIFSQLISSLKEGDSGLISYYIGNNPELKEGASLELAQNNQITFLEENNILKTILKESNAGAILIPNTEELINIAKSKNVAWATIKNPRLAFAEVLTLLSPPKLRTPSIHKSAVLGEQVEIGENVSIGANASIGERCNLGNNTVIHPGVVIYEDVTIGTDSEIHANSVIHRRSKIGNNCIIHSNAVIGSEGFGFIPTNSGWKKMPQTGLVVIEDEVEIGCSSAIDRPSVGETRIGQGSKIDNLVQIGHGVTTGKGCAMASQVGVAGGAQIGNGVILAGQVGIANRVKVGDNVVASSKSGITSNISSGEIVSGFPAIPNRLWLRCSAAFNKLPEMVKIIRYLKKGASG